MYCIRRTTQPGHNRFLLIPPKNLYSNQATQKNTCQIFVPKKLPESKISNPKKSFDHPRHLKSRVPPLGRCFTVREDRERQCFVVCAWSYLQIIDSQPQVMLILKKIAAHINYVFSLFHVKLELHTTKIAVCLIQICRI